MINVALLGVSIAYDDDGTKSCIKNVKTAQRQRKFNNRYYRFCKHIQLIVYEIKILQNAMGGVFFMLLFYYAKLLKRGYSP